MGLAIVVPGIDFSKDNLGQVTLVKDIPVESIVISAGERNGNTIPLNIVYTPATTSEKSVTWSLDSGDTDKFTIDQEGNVTILSTANNSSVVVKAVSTENSGVIATYQLSGLSWQISVVAPFETGYLKQSTLENSLKSSYDLLGNNDQWTLNFAIKDTGETYMMGLTGKLMSAGALELIYYQDDTRYTLQIRIDNKQYWSSDVSSEFNALSSSTIAGTSGTSLVLYGRELTQRNVVLVSIRRNGNRFALSADGGQHWANFTTSRDFVGAKENGVMKILKSEFDRLQTAYQFSLAIDNDAECLEFFNRYK